MVDLAVNLISAEAATAGLLHSTAPAPVPVPVPVPAAPASP